MNVYQFISSIYALLDKTPCSDEGWDEAEFVLYLEPAYGYFELFDLAGREGLYCQIDSILFEVVADSYPLPTSSDHWPLIKINSFVYNLIRALIVSEGS